MRKAWVLGLVGCAGAFALTFGVHRLAVSQVQIAPSFAPVGVAGSASTSTAWFHHPASGRVVACQVATAGGGIQCVEGRLP